MGKAIQDLGRKKIIKFFFAFVSRSGSNLYNKTQTAVRIVPKQQDIQLGGTKDEGIRTFISDNDEKM